MHRQLIAETTLAGLRPLGMGSRRIQDSWNEIDSYLRNRLGASYADFFAEPVQGAHGVSWFGAPEGEVKPYAELDDEAKAALLEEMQRRSETIRAHAETLAQSRRDSDRRLAQTLQWALVVPEAKPNRDFLYSAGGEPLLIDWGTRDENAQAGDSALQEFLTGEAWQLHRAKEAAAAPVHREPVAVREVATGYSLWWLLWLLFGLSIAGIMYLLLLGCGLRLPSSTLAPARWQPAIRGKSSCARRETVGAAWRVRSCCCNAIWPAGNAVRWTSPGPKMFPRQAKRSLRLLSMPSAKRARKRAQSRSFWSGRAMPISTCT